MKKLKIFVGMEKSQNYLSYFAPKPHKADGQSLSCRKPRRPQIIRCSLPSLIHKPNLPDRESELVQKDRGRDLLDRHPGWGQKERDVFESICS